ncbi:MAG: ABC transporter ATP-binding protein [Cytophagales bacterium]
MLKAQAITKSYGKLQVLKGIDLEIKSGEIVSIVGESGAGKSTLLHILSSLDEPDGGSVYLNDRDVNAMKRKDLATFRNNEIGFIFQFHNLLPEFSALENVMIPGMLGKRKIEEVKSKAQKHLDYLGLKDRMDHKPSELSGGEQQRVAVARALINSPKIIFADEPSGNLDSKNAEELHKLFFDLRDEFGQTFVIVTHNRELSKMADRRILMTDGKVNSD